MGNIENLKLLSRETVSDEQMFLYRCVMAAIWFPNDEEAQKRYMELPGQAPMGNVTESLCLTDENKVIGTASLYGFNNIQHKDELSGIERLEQLPLWLTETVYRGDLSVIPEYQGQGLASQLVNKLKTRAFSNVSAHNIIGITESSNESMINVVKKTGGRIVQPAEYQFIKLASQFRPGYLRDSHEFSAVPLYLDEKYPPVIHLFYDKKNELQAGTIATSPNVPGVDIASSTGIISELFPNQCIGFINPDLSISKLRLLLPTIYNAVSRYRYVSLFQHRQNLMNISSDNVIRNGFTDNWILYQYDK